MYRGRGVPTPGKQVYHPKGREGWLKKLPGPCRWATEKLHEECDRLLDLKQVTEKELVNESHKHRISKILATAPGMGSIRVAQLLPIVVTPHRFRARSQFWARHRG